MAATYVIFWDESTDQPQLGLTDTETPTAIAAADAGMVTANADATASALRRLLQFGVSLALQEKAVSS